MSMQPKHGSSTIPTPLLVLTATNIYLEKTERFAAPKSIGGTRNDAGNAAS
jgi:hypothetical protein